MVRTDGQTTYEEKLKKKTRTSGCAVGTVFGDMMEGLEEVRLPDPAVRTSWLYALAARINRTPSLYLEAGAIHGTVLCRRSAPAGLYGRCRAAQRGGQDRRLDVVRRGRVRRTRSCTPPGG